MKKVSVLPQLLSSWTALFAPVRVVSKPARSSCFGRSGRSDGRNRKDRTALMSALATMLVMLAALTVSVVHNAAQAQEQAETSAVEVDGEEGRPAMPRLFYTNEQRRILEVVRQELIAEESLEFEEFVPLVLAQQEVLEVIAGEELAAREHDLQMNAYIRNRKSGSAVLWINDESYQLTSEDGSGVLSFEGIDGLVMQNDGSVEGLDSPNGTRFVVRVGQKLAGDGEVNETYPVVVIKKN